MNFKYYKREYFNRLDNELIDFDCWGEEILPLNIIDFKNLIEREV